MGLFDSLFGGGGGDASQVDLLKTLLQIQQGTSATAGPYANLAATLTPAYGQMGLSNLQQQMFGYDSPSGGGIGTPATPPGGFYGSGAPAAPTGGPPVVGPVQGGAPGAPLPTIGAPTASPNAPNQLYSPPPDTRIGYGNTFDDPYAGGFANSPAASPGHHPGLLDLNTTALSSFGPLATLGLLESNPFAADALSAQNANLLNAGNSPILDLLKGQVMSQGVSGEMGPEALRSATQGSLADFSAGGSNNTNQAFASELFGRDAATQARARQFQQLAGLVEGLDTSRIGLVGNLGSQAVNSATSAITNPMLQILGLGNLNDASSNNIINAQNALNAPTMQLGGDVLGFNANATQAQNIANQNNQTATTAGWLGLAGTALGGWGSSDKRIKKNIKTVGKSPSGIPIKTWVYKYDPKKKKYRGAMAEDIKRLAPDAFLQDPITGIKMVNYDKIDVDFEQLSPFHRKAA
jgi:hypothetical protein